MSRFYATIQHTIAPNQKRYSVPFFIDFAISVLVVTVDNDPTPRTDYAFDEATQEIVFGAAIEGQKLLIRRDTMGHERVVQFTARSILSEGELNLNSDQILYILQEMYDSIILAGELGWQSISAIMAAITAHNNNPASHAALAESIKQQAIAAALEEIAEHNMDPDAHPNLPRGGAGDGVPPGCWFGWAGDLPIPAGYLLCDGSAVSRTEYPDLFNAIGTTHGAGNGSTTFNVPDFRGDFIRGYQQGVTAEIGKTQPEGLPNITGAHGLQNTRDRDALGLQGCFSLLETNAFHGIGNADNDNARIQFDASKSNPIYGASEHVTPVNEASHFIIKAVKDVEEEEQQ